MEEQLQVLFQEKEKLERENAELREEMSEAHNSGKEEQEKLLKKISQLQREKGEGEYSRIRLEQEVSALEALTVSNEAPLLLPSWSCATRRTS